MVRRMFGYPFSKPISASGLRSTCTGPGEGWTRRSSRSYGPGTRTSTRTGVQMTGFHPLTVYSWSNLELKLYRPNPYPPHSHPSQQHSTLSNLRNPSRARFFPSPRVLVQIQRTLKVYRSSRQ